MRTGLLGTEIGCFKQIASTNVIIELAVELDIAEPIRREHDRISTACARYNHLLHRADLNAFAGSIGMMVR